MLFYTYDDYQVQKTFMDLIKYLKIKLKYIFISYEKNAGILNKKHRTLQSKRYPI